MANFPRFRLYDSTGNVLVYEFDKVTGISPNVVANDAIGVVTHSSLRGIGEIIVPGSKLAYDRILEFLFIGEGSTDQEKYIDLATKMDDVQTKIVTGTRYILKIDLSLSKQTSEKVMRFQDINFPVPTTGQKVLNFQRGTIILRAYSIT